MPSKEQYWKYREYYQEYYRTNYKKWKRTNKERKRMTDLRERQRLKEQVLTHYGNGKLACVDCGFSEIRALCLDHINGGGAKERKEFSNALHLYRYLRQQNFPVGYACRCANCNMIKAHKNNEY